MNYWVQYHFTWFWEMFKSKPKNKKKKVQTAFISYFLFFHCFLFSKELGSLTNTYLKKNVYLRYNAFWSETISFVIYNKKYNGAISVLTRNRWSIFIVFSYFLLFSNLPSLTCKRWEEIYTDILKLKTWTDYLQTISQSYL